MVHLLDLRTFVRAATTVSDTGTEQPSEVMDGSLEPEFISVPELARRLGISAESAYKAARLGDIPGCFSIGRLYRVNWPVFVQATGWMRSGHPDAG
jgi:hypothetical protein